MTRLRTVRRVDGDRVTVEAGATWREVLAATLPHGLAPPVLPDYLDLTIGGTLAVGGVGRRDRAPRRPDRRRRRAGGRHGSG